MTNPTPTQFFPIEKHYSIPKKPTFKVIKCSSETRARLIQVKLWKPHALYLCDPKRQEVFQQSQGSQPNAYNLMISKTSQKALKDLRRLSLHSSNDGSAPQRLLMTHKFRHLEKLQVSIYLIPRIIKLLKTSINPNLKHLSLKGPDEYSMLKETLEWENYFLISISFQKSPTSTFGSSSLRAKNLTKR